MNRAPHLLVSGVVLGQPMGGVRRHNRELLPRLARLLGEHGGSMAVLEGKDKIEFELPESIAILRSNVPMHPVLLRAEAESRALRKALRTKSASGKPFDLVHTAHMPAPRGLEVPFTVTLHDLRAISETNGSAPRRAIAKRVLADAMKRALRVFTVSGTVATELRRHFVIEEHRVGVIPNGVDHFTPAPRDVTADAPIRCIGHVEPRKNIELVLRALALDETLPRVEVCGAGKGAEIERLTALAAELGVANRVHFSGAFDEADLPRLLATAACVCIPSWIEGFGIVALEAQRALAPIAVARGSSLNEVAGDGTPSFAPTDAAACAKAIHAAIATKQSVLAHAQVRADRFTWDAAARAWFDGLMAAR
ncbi:MAG: glycosyltransferase family 1 protein [Planctomycetota bacterium]|nr:glycosyltransferase family 1 protein [Planctomycetota bacterium]